jgi:AraC-like DNA-binding protein
MPRRLMLTTTAVPLTRSTSAARARWKQLAASPSVREQQVAFTCATGVPLTLLPASQPAGGVLDSAYCVQGCLGEPSGDLCQRKLLQAEKRAVRQSEAVQYCCPSGLVKILVPVFIGGQHAGSLLAGPFTLQSLDGVRLAELMERLEAAGLGGRVRELETTWRYSPLLSSEKCRAAATLLGMFARYLEECGRKWLAASGAAGSPLVEKIEAFLAQNQNGRVSLRDVAARVNLSPCHFCSVFKKQTGLTFTEYRNQRRLGRAEELLRDPGRRVSDVAFEAGFDSIPYFNRAFRRRFGCSPTTYRRRLMTENADKRIATEA